MRRQSRGCAPCWSSSYSPGAEIKILHAGPNYRDGSRPYVWYVIAEVRAAARADGSPLGHNGCDAPGSYFLQTREGWVYVPEGAFPEWISNWMDAFHLAGPGEFHAFHKLGAGPVEQVLPVRIVLGSGGGADDERPLNELYAA